MEYALTVGRRSSSKDQKHSFDPQGENRIPPTEGLHIQRRSTICWDFTSYRRSPSVALGLIGVTQTIWVQSLDSVRCLIETRLARILESTSLAPSFSSLHPASLCSSNTQMVLWRTRERVNDGDNGTSSRRNCDPCPIYGTRHQIAIDCGTGIRCIGDQGTTAAVRA